MLRMSLIFAAASLAALAGCRSAGNEDAPDVVATTTHVADLAENVAGGRAEVDAILFAGSDPHDYEPRPSDAAAIAGAKLVIASGGEVDEWADELIESSGTDAEVLTLTDSLRLMDGGDSEPDPHWWHDPVRGGIAADAIRHALARFDPSGRDFYAENAEEYKSELEALDDAIIKCFDRVPESARKLVTSHDALGYLADRYEIDVVGAAIPALSTQAQPSAGETADLVELIRAEDVKAVFAEAGLPDELETAIAGDAGIALGGELYADSLGQEGSAGETYLGAIRANATTLIEGFSDGHPPSCPELGLGL